MTLATLEIEEGFYRFGPEARRIYECPLGKKSCGRLVLYQPAFVSHSRSYVSGKNITGENRFTGQIPVFGGLGKLTHLDLGKE